MRYQSTRGGVSDLTFCDAVMMGLAADGGLLVPQHIPDVRDELHEMKGMDYPSVANRIMGLFIDDIPADDLAALIDRSYSTFDSTAVTPLVQVGDFHVLELFHGPTLAFKDVALQFLGNLFEYNLRDHAAHLNILGATSGDTGSAAIDAVAGLENVEIFMLHPKGRVSDVQRRQMTTVRAPNVHNIAIDGSFDDAQAMVKRIFADETVTAKHRIGAVNSINWARLMAQVVYYFAASLQLGGPERKLAFSVPTGNFGDVFAGHVAARMGLPIEQLIVATNVNDILHRALSAGDYSTGTVTPTSAPSMDIQVSSNFERLLYDVGGRDGAAMADQMHAFDAARAMQLTNAQREGASALFTSLRADEDDMARAMRWACETCAEVVDPHTAIGLHAAREADLPADVPVVTLATAHPAKFPDAVERATGTRPSLPGRVGDLFAREEAYTELPGTYEAVRDHILGNAS